MDQFRMVDLIVEKQNLGVANEDVVWRTLVAARGEHI